LGAGAQGDNTGYCDCYYNILFHNVNLSLFVAAFCRCFFTSLNTPRRAESLKEL
jgi:hypothetical protein